MAPPGDRFTFHTLAGAFAARIKKTPAPGECAARYSSAISCLRWPAVQ
jgi:hypothetical protein